MTRNSRHSTADARGGTLVLGIDPGTLATGFGLVAREHNFIRLVAWGSIRNPTSAPMGDRLRRIYRELGAVIDRHRPDQLAIESAFYGKNAQSALKLGHARGVAMLAAVEHGLAAAEYSPREVKKAVTGRGAASKAQVRYMVRSMLAAEDGRMSLDASDALAIALCHIQRLSAQGVKHRSWSSFVAAHPEKIIT